MQKSRLFPPLPSHLQNRSVVVGAPYRRWALSRRVHQQPQRIAAVENAISLEYRCNEAKRFVCGVGGEGRRIGVRAPTEVVPVRRVSYFRIDQVQCFAGRDAITRRMAANLQWAHDRASARRQGQVPQRRPARQQAVASIDRFVGECCPLGHAVILGASATKVAALRCGIGAQGGGVCRYGGIGGYGRTPTASRSSL